MSTNLNKPEQIAVNVLSSIFNNNFINKYLAEYGKYGLYHHILAKFPNSNHILLGIDPKYNLILSKIKMRAKAQKAIKSINRLLFSIGDLYPTSNNNDSYKVCVVLTKLADGKPTREGYLDKRNGQPVKPELTAIHRKFIKQVARNGKLAITDFENPVKISKYRHLYSEPHNHNILIAKQSQKYQLQRQLQQDFNKVTGYKPVKATIRPITYHHKQPKNMDELLKAVDDTVFYFMTDDDLQTKDCDPELFKDDKHSKLSHNQRQLAFRSQLKTYKGTSSTTYSHLHSKHFNQSINQQQSQPSNISQISDLKAQLKLAKITAKHQKGKPKQHTKHLIIKLTDQITTNSTTGTSHNLLDQLERLPEWDYVDMLCGYRFARYYWTGAKATYHLKLAKLLHKPISTEPLLITRDNKKDATPSVLQGTATGIPP